MLILSAGQHTVTHSGARQLDAIAAQTHTIAQSAAGARTPAAQRMVLAALRSQVSQAKNVVTTDLGTRQVAVPACGGWASRKKRGARSAQQVSVLAGRSCVPRGCQGCASSSMVNSARTPPTTSCTAVMPAARAWRTQVWEMRLCPG